MDKKKEPDRIMEQYGNSVYRISYYILQNAHDAQDVLQETLIKYLLKAPAFRSAEHEKAWIFRVANNLCRDMLRFQKRHQHLSLDEVRALEDNRGAGRIFAADHGAETSEGELITLIFSLKDKYKQVVFLHYYEGYGVKEIGAILGVSEAAVKKRLERARQELKQKIGGKK